MRVLVTGGAGFIGFYTVKALLNRGFEVIVYDNLARAQFSRNVEELGATLVKGDVRDGKGLERALQGVDYVIHLAALTSVEESHEKPLLYHDVNAGGTLSVLLSSRKAGVSRVVVASSAAVYGNPLELPIDEEHPLRPISVYGASKAAAEAYCRAFRALGLDIVILRPFNVYGGGQSPSYAGVITAFIRQLLRGEPPIIHGDGLQTRDFVYVEDVAEAFVLALETEAPSAVYNIGTGRETRILDLAHMLIKISGVNVSPVFSSPRPGDIRRSVASVRRAEEELGFKPRTSLEEGLRQTYEWYRAQLS